MRESGDGSVFVVAGELSGDMHAAELVRELKARRPDIDVWGIGGDHLLAEGMKVSQHCRDMAVMGIWEVLKRYGFFRKIFDRTLAAVLKRRPSVVLLVDYPGFNLRLAKALKESGIPVVQYICPQVWAWKKGRIPTMVEVLDQVLCILPFEPEIFEDTALKATFAGHPLVPQMRAVRASEKATLPWEGFDRRVALLPGSRAMEVERLLPVMIEAAVELDKQKSDVHYVIGASDEERAEQIQEIVAASSAVPHNLHVVVGQAREVMRQASAAWIASGTATLEAGLLGCPMVIVYKTAWLTYEIGRRVLTIDHVGLVNILAKRGICPELLQHDATAEGLVSSIVGLVDEGQERDAMVRDLNALEAGLGAHDGPGFAVDQLMPYLDGTVTQPN